MQKVENNFGLTFICISRFFSLLSVLEWYAPAALMSSVSLFSFMLSFSPQVPRKGEMQNQVDVILAYYYCYLQTALKSARSLTPAAAIPGTTSLCLTVLVESVLGGSYRTFYAKLRLNRCYSQTNLPHVGCCAPFGRPQESPPVLH